MNHADTSAQPAPTPGRESVTDAVIADMEHRRRQGTAKYGTELQTHNGRDPLIDAYQEALDLVMYLKQALLERDSVTSTLVPVAELRRLRRLHDELFNELGTTDPRSVRDWIARARQAARAD